MKNLFILFAIALLSFSTVLSLEPVKVAFTHSGTTPVSVEIKLTDYTGGTANTLYTQSAASYTPNGSGVIIATVADSSWATITPSQVNAYCVLDVYVGGDLYAQYRLDKLILNQSSNSLLDNDGNLSPAESGGADLGNDNNRWGELFLTGNTLHVGPDGGMAGSNELAISYDDTDSSAHFTVAGTNAFEVYANGEVVVPALGNGSSTQNLQVDGNGKLVVGGGVAFTSSAGTTKANSETDNFFVGKGNLNNNTSSEEKKMYFDYTNGAFRAGAVNGTEWNIRGDYSFASGYNTEASGFISTAMGDGTEASGYFSTAMGVGTVASGGNSTAMGDGTEARGDNSVAMGYGTFAVGNASTAMGNSTITNGANSTAMGAGTEASGRASTAMGNYTAADADYSTAMGNNTIAGEDNSVAMGIFNDQNITGELLTVGNGDFLSRSNAFEVYMNGDVVVPSGSLKVTELGNGSSTQNLQVDTSGKLVASSTVSVIFSSTAPSNPTTGTLWYDSAASALKIWNGSTWVTI